MAPEAPPAHGIPSAIAFLVPLRPQGEEGLESGAVEGAGIELDSGGKQRSLIKALKAFSLALIVLSRSVSFSIRSLSFFTCKISFSIRSVSLLTCKMSLSSCFIRCSCCILRCSCCILRSS